LHQHLYLNNYFLSTHSSIFKDLCACNITKKIRIQGVLFRQKQQKTPPLGEVGGEKQYKDYEKNPLLSFFMSFDAANI
jgi:hypothetical protein